MIYFIPVINERHTNIIEIADETKECRSIGELLLSSNKRFEGSGWKRIPWNPMKIWNKRFNDCRKIERKVEKKKIDSEGIAANCWKAVFLSTYPTTSGERRQMEEDVNYARSSPENEFNQVGVSWSEIC